MDSLLRDPDSLYRARTIGTSQRANNGNRTLDKQKARPRKESWPQVVVGQDSEPASKQTGSESCPTHRRTGGVLLLHGSRLHSEDDVARAGVSGRIAHAQHQDVGAGLQRLGLELERLGLAV